MEGVLAITSTTSSTVGQSRVLSYNANIQSNRGYLKANTGDSNSDDLNIGSLQSLAEIATPLVTTHDAPMRTNMVTAQSKQSIPIAKTNKLLITNNSETVLTHTLGKDFVFTARDDGKVIEYDEKTEMMVLEYKNGKKDIIDLSCQTVKNGGGGFYLINQLSTDYKVGDTFKKDETLAYNHSFFSENMEGTDAEYAMSKLAKVAFFSGDFTHEDSSLVTNKLCEDMSSKITMKKEKILNKNSNVDYIVKKGQYVKTGEPLLIFEQGYDEEEMNMMLTKVADDLNEEITKLSKNQITSKYTGTVDDIQIYYTCDIQDLSPSLQKIVKAYKSSVISKEKLIKKYFDNPNDANIILPPAEKVDTNNAGKIKGKEMVDSVMIEFYVTYFDKLNVGDKISLNSAIKSVISTVIPDETAPYSDYKKDEQLNAIFSYISVNARQTTNVYLSLYGNKVLKTLKDQVAEIWKS
jgi:hypothetical protein